MTDLTKRGRVTPRSHSAGPRRGGGHGAPLPGRVVATAGGAGDRGGALQLPYADQTGSGRQTQAAGQTTRAAGSLARDGAPVCPSRLFLAGKSMGKDGGRAVLRGGDKMNAAGLIVLGILSTPAKPDAWRARCSSRSRHTLLLQGADTFGSTPSWPISPSHPPYRSLADRRDHGFKPRRRAAWRAGEPAPGCGADQGFIAAVGRS